MSERPELSYEVQQDALNLAEEILKNIELSEIKLDAVALKASRLARILDEFDYQKIFQYEAGGYPGSPAGVPADVFELSRIAKRVYQSKVKENEVDVVKEYTYKTSIAAIEGEIATLNSSMGAAADPHVSVSSSNPHQMVWNPVGNKHERETIRKSIAQQVERLASRRAFIHEYASSKYYQLKLSRIASDIFVRARARLDSLLQLYVPTSVQKTAAIYTNLSSSNPEDWSNAVHSCRRLLQDLADVLYPPRSDVNKNVGGKEKLVRLGPDAYINRLIAYIEENSGSERFEEIVGSHLRFVGERLDAVFKAAQKGSHASINTREEADRYVIYTYLIAGDILTLSGDSARSSTEGGEALVSVPGGSPS